MAIINKKKFCELIGCEEKALPVYYSRGKFIYVNGIHKGKNACIDTMEPINAAFIEYIISKKGAVVAQAETTQTSPAMPQELPNSPIIPRMPSFGQQMPQKQPEPAANQPQTIVNIVNSNKNEQNLALFATTELIKKKDLELKSVELEIRQIELAKKSGELIPTEPAHMVMSQFARSVAIGLRDKIEKRMQSIAIKYMITATDVAEYRKGFISDINEVNLSAVEEVGKGIAKIVTEFSEKRGVGQRL